MHLQMIFKSFRVIALVWALTIGSISLAQQQKADENAEQKKSDKLDVTDLEKKYWAAKDTDFSVVQNRTYSKANRFALSPSYGYMLNDTWSDGPTYGLAANYYFSERYGVQLTSAFTQSKDNDATSNLKAQNGVADHNKIKAYYGAAFNWVPFYAKMSALNSKIIYFDMTISPGLGMTEYEQQVVTGNVKQSAPTLSLDVTQHFFLNKYFALRMDFVNRWYKQDIVKYRTTAGMTTGQKVKDEMAHSSFLMFGFTFYF